MSYDIVVWGATGFTGQLIAQYLWKSPTTKHIKWAIAGRDEGKLKTLRSELGDSSHIGILVGSLDSDEGIDNVVTAGKVIISAAGPYYKVGHNVVKSCVKNKRDYVDVTGETIWVREMIDKYQQTAVKNGVLLVPMAGFDSVPSDIGALFTIQNMMKKFGNNMKLKSITNYVAMQGKLSGGTLQSGILMDTLEGRKNDPFILGGGSGATNLKDHADFNTYMFDEKINKWVAPFMMGVLNTRVVRRSHLLFSEAKSDLYYKGPFIYQEKAVARDQSQARAMAKPLAPPSVRMSMVEKGNLPKPGEGPSESERKNNHFKMLFLGETEDNKTLTVSVSGGDAYEFTALSAVETALTILSFSEKSISKPIGFSTPAVACGALLQDRLEKVGITFKVEKVEEEEANKSSGTAKSKL